MAFYIKVTSEVNITLVNTKLLTLENMESKIRRSYGIIVISKFYLNGTLLAKVYDSVIMSNILYLVPFSWIFSQSDRLKRKHVLFGYAKFLLRVP